MIVPNWLDRKAVLEIHHEVIVASGGLDGVRDETLLESALARPQNILAYQDANIFDLAACYAEAIAHNHPFLDGNKRTAFIAADIFLDINGFRLKADKTMQADLMVDLAEKKIEREVVAAFFEQYSVRSAIVT